MSSAVARFRAHPEPDSGIEPKLFGFRPESTFAFPPESPGGIASGLTGMGRALGGMLANLGTGYIVRQFSYAPIFAMAGIVHPLAACLVMWLLPNGYFTAEVIAERK